MLDLNELNALPAWYERLAESSQPVYIYGMGDGCEKVLSAFEAENIECSGIFVSDDFKRDKVFHGFKLIGMTELERSGYGFSVACGFGTSLPEIMERIAGLSERHLLVYPDTAVIGEGYLRKDDLLSRSDDIMNVYDMLSDEVSRNTFANVLKFKITGDIRYLDDWNDTNDVYRLLDISDDEIYADLGAYTGDTIESFLKYTGGRYRRIYAVEPSRRNFSKCVKRCLPLENVILVNAAVSDNDGTAFFSKGAGRQQSISENGIPVVLRCLDSILNGEECTFIKYDVEGADIPALLGSRDTIENCCPKIRTGIYHRPFDILDIPLMLHKLQPKYKLYMRRPRYYPAWDLELIAKA